MFVFVFARVVIDLGESAEHDVRGGKVNGGRGEGELASFCSELACDRSELVCVCSELTCVCSELTCLCLENTYLCSESYGPAGPDCNNAPDVRHFRRPKRFRIERWRCFKNKNSDLTPVCFAEGMRTWWEEGRNSFQL